MAVKALISADAADPLTKALRRLRAQKYHLIGAHSAVKKCLWVHNALTEGRFCYKCKFYGIESHRCVQFSPSTLWCWNACLHCWRVRPQDIGLTYEDLTRLPYVDDPEFIAEMAVLEHRRTVSGYRGRAPKGVWEEAMNPKHVAISLTGEATLYPRLGELIEVFHRMGLTTFLVTRGIRPEVLAGLTEEPTQLYVSLESWSREMYEYFNRPLTRRGWDKTLETINILPSFTCPTVVRVTVVKGFNMGDRDVNGFSKLLKVAEPTFIEVKAYMHVGGSVERLSRDNMPSFKEVAEFAGKLADKLSYRVASFSIPSRVVLLTRLEGPVIRYGKGCPRGWGEKDIGDELSGEYGRVKEVV